MLADHLAIAAGARPGVLQRGLAARAGEVVDEHRDLVIHHQRQVGLGVLDLGFGHGPDVGIDREGDVVGFVDGRGLGARLAEAVALLQRRHLQLVDRLDDLVEFALQLLVVAHIQIAAQQGIEGLIEIGLRRLQMSRLIVGLAGGILLLCLRDQGIDGIGLRLGSFLDLGRRRGLLDDWRRDFRRGGGGREEQRISWVRWFRNL